MGCGSCSSGACGTGSIPNGCGNNGNCVSGGCNKLEVFDWLAGLSSPFQSEQDRIVEVRFKNTRKDFYRYQQDITPNEGDNVVVDSTFGKDVGTVSLTGELVKVQMKRKGIRAKYQQLPEVVRLANQEDIDSWQEAQKREQTTMIEARKIADQLKLDMKISDVEFQGDGTKAIFYYTAEGRVDFRELIKSFAGKFKVRIEMKQIGARQEAGRVGGIGSCGRELCCSTWLTDFRSVSTSAARYQQLAINPMKLAGQCGKLKCCLNFELDSYMDALKDFPKGDIQLKTHKGLALLQKTDIFKRVLWFNFKEEPAVFHPVTLDRVKEIMAMNAKGKKPENLLDQKEYKTREKKPDFENVVGQDDLKRFDQKRKKKKRRPQKGKAASGNQPKAQTDHKNNNKRKGRNKRRKNNNSGNQNTK